jgi:hypothetical protein
MRNGFLSFALLSAAASLLTACSSSTPNGSIGTNPAKTTPTITWAQPAAISNATPLSSTQLNATANVNGTFTYSPAAGAILSPGNQKLSVTFTPEDSAAYNTASASVSLQVNSVDKPVTSANCSSGPSTGASDFVYLSAGADPGGPFQIEGYAPNPDGSLVPVAGSPFATDKLQFGTVGAGQVLFAVDGYSVYSYGVHSDGCISLENTAAVGQGPQDNPYTGPTRLYLDPNTSNLYSYDFVPSEEAFFASYNFDPQSGAVTMLSQTNTDMANDGGLLTFDATGKYAITADCTIRDGTVVSVFQRGSNGTLDSSPFAFAPLPATPDSTVFCPLGAASDRAAHIVVAGNVCNNPMPCESFGPWELAIYSIDSSGNMTTASTSQNMPVLNAISSYISPSSYEFSSDNRYFAIGSYTGIEVFLWDSNAATLTLIATVSNTQGSCNAQGCSGNGYGNLAWDSNHHFYSWIGNQLVAYEVSDTGVTQAPGSPYPVRNPQWLAVVKGRSN